MALTFSEKGADNGKFLVPSGSHIALCNLVVYLGIQPGSGKYPEPKPQLLIGWELPHEIIEYEKDGKQLKGPRVINKTYTASMGKKSNLRKDLESWRGKAFGEGEAGSFDISKVLGVGCMLNVIHSQGSEKTYANVSSVSGVPKGTVLPGFATKPLYYGPDDKTLYDELHEWIRKKIDGQIILEPKKMAGADGVDFNPGFGEVIDDDIPF